MIFLAIANEKWQTKQPTNPYNSVGDTVHQMHQRRFFGTKCWLGYTPFNFNNDTINQCLREIKPNNCAVLLRSASFAGEEGLKESVKYFISCQTFSSLLVFSRL